jgi:hypothetical protein
MDFLNRYRQRQQKNPLLERLFVSPLYVIGRRWMMIWGQVYQKGLIAN